MGCDIHVHTEVFMDGKWHHYGHPFVKRKYSMFAKMAGVRNWDESGIVPLDAHKGMPDDATELTQHALTLDNYHDLCWLDREQIKELVEWYERIATEGREDYDDIHGLESEFDYLLEGHGWASNAPVGKIEDWRFIFWFDN